MAKPAGLILGMDKKLLEQAFTRLCAAADLRIEVTLSSPEAEELVKWIRREKYRTQRIRPLDDKGAF